jgi:hypothetical protein
MLMLIACCVSSMIVSSWPAGITDGGGVWVDRFGHVCGRHLAGGCYRDRHRGTVTAEGDLDFRGTLAIAKDAPVGLQVIRLRFQSDTDATEEQLQSLIRLAERYCVVYQSLRRSPEITVS